MKLSFSDYKLYNYNKTLLYIRIVNDIVILS